MNRPLTPAQCAELQATLEQARAAVAATQAEHLAGASRAEHAHEVLQQDADDARQRDADREVDLAIADREVVALADIESALQRLARGDFGRCQDCDEPIAWARLQLQPTALRCIACANRLERQAPRPPSL